MMVKRIIAVVMFAGMLSMLGCAVGQRFDYRSPVVSMDYSGSLSVAAAVHDQRPYVISKKSAPQYVGLMRGGYGNPFHVGTVSGMPMADDMLESLSDSLRRAGFTVVPIPLTPWDSGEEALTKFKNTRADRFILVTLDDWRSNTYQNTGLYFNVTLRVIDRDGKVLGQSTVSGEQNLGGNVWNPPAHAKAAVQTGYSEQFGKLLNAPEVRAALQ